MVISWLRGRGAELSFAFDYFLGLIFGLTRAIVELFARLRTRFLQAAVVKIP
jgi:hypothetical protein